MQQWCAGTRLMSTGAVHAVALSKSGMGLKARYDSLTDWWQDVQTEM